MGVSSFIKSKNEKFAALPIIMFGGSPIKVAVPPMFDENISPIKNGIGFKFNDLQIENVIGISKITVVTLSKNALTAAVKKQSDTKILRGFPFVSLTIFTAAYENIPLREVIETIIIIEISKNTTLKSM